VKARTNSGETPLSLAASAGRVDTVKSLLQWVGQLKIEDLNMQGALTNAYRSGQNEIVRLLVNKPAPIQLTGGRNERKLVFAILRGDREKADEALSGPIDIACRTDAGDTPIGIAAALGHAGIVRSLLESGDKPDTRQADGRTPLMLAARNGHLVTATALIQAGADVNAVDRERWSALILAAETGQVRMAQMLLKRGAHVDARNKSDTSALAAAAYEGHTETVKALLAASASVGITDENGNTPLMIAAAAGRLDIVKLLAKDSDLNARNKQKAGALMLAIKNRRLDTVKFLLSRGCDPSLQDWEGKTASALASERGSDEIVELLKTHQPSAAGVNE
jgi:ankyrin repeat protein